MVPIKISFKKLRYYSVLIKEVVTLCYYVVTHNNLENIFMCVCVLRMCVKEYIALVAILSYLTEMGLLSLPPMVP